VPDAPVRAITRRPARAELPDGVDVARADLGDPGSLTAALNGVDQVFLRSGVLRSPRLMSWGARALRRRELRLRPPLTLE
jgi:uncharacterized protein YbjT (DUF2867 family)